MLVIWQGIPPRRWWVLRLGFFLWGLLDWCAKRCVYHAVEGWPVSGVGRIGVAVSDKHVVLYGWLDNAMDWGFFEVSQNVFGEIPMCWCGFLQVACQSSSFKRNGQPRSTCQVLEVPIRNLYVSDSMVLNGSDFSSSKSRLRGRGVDRGLYSVALCFEGFCELGWVSLCVLGQYLFGLSSIRGMWIAQVSIWHYMCAGVIVEIGRCRFGFGKLSESHGS